MNHSSTRSRPSSSGVCGWVGVRGRVCVCVDMCEWVNGCVCMRACMSVCVCMGRCLDILIGMKSPPSHTHSQEDGRMKYIECREFYAKNCDPNQDILYPHKVGVDFKEI